MASGWGVGGRPKVVTQRLRRDYPPPTPQPTPCILWQGSVDRDGYGLINPESCYPHGDERPPVKRRFRLIRWVWEMANGPIPPGMVIRHLCDNRPCYRLSHLELGTVAENNDDIRRAGRVGPATRFTEADIERLRRERAEGKPYKQIYDDWPEIRTKVALATLRGALAKNRTGQTLPEGYVPTENNFRHHRNKKRKRDEIVAPYTDWRDRDRPS